MTGLAEPGGGLHPTERLLDAFSAPLADRITAVAGGAAVDRRAAARQVPSDIGRDADRPQVGDMPAASYALSAPSVARRPRAAAAIIASAASRSARPVAWVVRTSTIRP